MPLGNRFVLSAILLSLAVLAACGGGGGSSNPPVNPPPSGSFSNSNLNGTYVFSVTGTANDANSDFVTIMGVFTADGNGNIANGGLLDQNSTAQNGLILDSITSGTYNVGADGRATGTSTIPTGLITLQTLNSGTFQFAYVLTSSTHGLVTQFENFGSASGTLDMQASVTQSQISGQSYVFNLTGSSGVGADLCGIATGGSSTPFATVGAFTLDANGQVASGVQDFNNNCASSGSTNIAITGGDIDLTTFPGTARLTSGTSTVPYTFDVYPIDATHLKFIEIDSQPVLVGDVFTQATSFPTGNNVFTIAGIDIPVGGPFTAAGIFHFDSNGNIMSDSFEDINDAGSVNQFGAAAGGAAITAISTPLTGGRTEITFTSGFVNGNNLIPCSSNCIFAAYPSVGGLQLLEIDDGGSTNGIAYLQSATSLASGVGYGMNLTGVTTNSSEDDVAEFTNNNGVFKGIIDINDQGSTSFKNAFSGIYSADDTIPGRGGVGQTTNAPLLTTYVIDGSTAVAVSADTGFVGLGALVAQNASAKSNVVASHLSVLRSRPSAHSNSTRNRTPPTRSK
ncbi:MAG TPA: hypothetical protein VMS18_17640 [Candidatus Binatia bacterium]|nr:hypothetical protein [Candidatus Binatia bacterium]